MSLSRSQAFRSWIYLCWLLLTLLPLAAKASSLGTHQRTPLADNWHYRWGDSPIIDGVPQWTQEHDKLAWMPIQFPSDPPFRDGRHNVWYRYDLPETPLPGYSLFITSVDLIVEVYLEDRLIYNYGSFAADGSGSFEGWPWHLIDLPPDSSGKSLYFRVYSDYSDIGLWGEIALGSEYAHLQHMIRQDLFPVAVGLVLIVSGIIMLCSTLACWRLPVLIMGAFLINLGCIPIIESQIKQLLLFQPIFWQYFAAGSYFLLPVSMAGFVHALYGKGIWRSHQLVWGVHLLFVIAALALAGMGVSNLSSFYLYFDLLALFTLLALAIALAVAAIQGSCDQRILAVGFGLFYVIMVYNGLTAHGILPFAPRTEYMGPLLIGICFLIILIRRYTQLSLGFKNRSQELEAINASLEQRVHERTTALQNLNRSKDQFFTIIAHDLKSPLGALLHLMQDYERKRISIPLNELSELRRNCQKTYDLLTRLLTWARAQQGQIVPQKETVAAKTLIETTLDEMRPIATAKHIELLCICPWEPLLDTDIEMLSTIIRNLVGNAIKFTPVGGVVRVEIKQGLNETRFSVLDNGIGLPEENLDQLFQPKEYSSIRTDTDGKKGSGLGLLLCKEFIEAQGGRLAAESPEAGGSLFWFTLPNH
ncbi:HAMP domain-containing sensor histidine kinase [Coraliomargarita algicola]|uniref:histidine kinase n=1 Tax=Coraliomargarita algicola TaxID=3092156 RepID=A0ABZ0RG64_9BACT|nr:HAMP domain-containing sensor histidine kinase [Coraliomargarita sp. J2-16]WPJ94015.1 HAMP domain-containing sensor histidine kinase [Coraliomargarita sp. J2-16]